MDLLGLRQTADRLSQAALILHSPAPSWSPPAASPLSPATCLSENNTAAPESSGGEHSQSKEARQDTDLCHPFSASKQTPLTFHHNLSCGEDRLRRGRTWRPGFVCRYQERSRSASRTAGAATALRVKPGLPPSHRSHLHGCTMATFVCRVQFLDDTDPFNSTNFPEPTRPPLYTFREDIPLINQLAGVHRLLKAPHKVGLPNVNNRY